MSITAKKSLGQHFLLNPRILDKIVEAAEITKDDIVLEVGPGTGNLTQKLAEKAKKVVAVEKDRRFIEPLREKFNSKNVEIIESDVLKFKIETLIENLKLKIENYKIIANVPYYITSRFIRMIFEDWPKPKLAVLTIQKEVAQRIIAKPPKMSLLAVSVQYFSEPKIVGYISRKNFRPSPKVDSAIIRLTPTNGDKKSTRIYADKFFKIARAGFSQKRKLLINNLVKKLKLDKERVADIFKKLGIKEKARAENLSLNDWINLADKLK